MGIFTLIMFFLLFIGGIGYTVYCMKQFKKSDRKELDKKDFNHFLIANIALSLSGFLLVLSCMLLGSWQMQVAHVIMAMVGASLAISLAHLFWASFYFYFYYPELHKGQRKIAHILLYAAILPFIATFLLAGEGLAPYMSYPLVSGVAVVSSGFHWMDANHTYTYESGLRLPWYGVIILGGAVLAWKMSDHRFYQKYGRHGILDTCFLICFPAGILGARIWYVVGNWNGDVGGITPFAERIANGEWWSIFAIWEGGLTILGGAVGGILGGMIYMLLFRKYVDIRVPFDIVVPTILVAQAIGRWGNFFNHEVYGAVTDISAWPLLPTWIKYQMATGWTNGLPADGTMYVPLFLIEGLLNLAGYFIIAHLIPKLWKKGRALGDLAGFYMIWYGTVRIIMEPMRDPTFNMGTNGLWSVWNSMVYIIIGVAMVAFFQIFAFVRAKKGLPVEMGTGVDAVKKEKPAKQKADPLAKPKAIPASEESKPDVFSKPKKIPTAEEETKEGEGDA